MLAVKYRELREHVIPLWVSGAVIRELPCIQQIFLEAKLPDTCNERRISHRLFHVVPSVLR